MLVHELKTILDSVPDDVEIEIVYEDFVSMDWGPVSEVKLVDDKLQIRTWAK